MSFKKIQLISPEDIGCPDLGHIYLGRDSVGLWEKFDDCSWHYITTGGTSAAGTSGTSGIAGSSGVDGSFLGSSGTSGGSGIAGSSGKNGSSGKTGLDGTSGTSGGTGTSGTSGTSGKTGTSGSSGSSGFTGTAGTSGSSGSSGVDGNFYGSSGSSGYSGGYGGSTRKWISTTSPTPSAGQFYGTSVTYTGFDFQLIDKVSINYKDADTDILTNWLTNWTRGILKIENRENPKNFGLYDVNNGPTYSGGNFIFTGITCMAGFSGITSGLEYLISFVINGSGSAGTSGAAGSSGVSDRTFTWIVASPVGDESGVTVLGPRIPSAATVSRIDSYVKANTNVEFNVSHGSIATQTNIMSAVGTSVTGGFSTTTFASASISSGDWLVLAFYAVSGTPDIITVTITLT